MKTKIVLLILAAGLSAQAQTPEPPQPATRATTNEPASDQKPSPEHAQQVIGKFKEAYLKLGSPRFLIYVNRELDDDAEASKPSGKKEKSETKDAANAADGTSAQNPPSGVVDKQTIQNIEQLFGRPLRAAGASITDQKAADKLMAGKKLKAPNPAGEARAQADRDSLRKVADAAIEILVSSRTVTVKDASGDKTVSVPDIQASAIRLEDARIIGQASNAALQAGESDARDASEAVALALMEDMVREAK